MIKKNLARKSDFIINQLINVKLFYHFADMAGNVTDVSLLTSGGNQAYRTIKGDGMGGGELHLFTVLQRYFHSLEIFHVVYC